jgi:hypothetical protein
MEFDGKDFIGYFQMLPHAVLTSKKITIDLKIKQLILVVFSSS